MDGQRRTHDDSTMSTYRANMASRGKNCRRLLPTQFTSPTRRNLTLWQFRRIGVGDVTRCLHFTAGCTTGWVNYANERSQAALERSSQDAYDVIRLTRSKAAVWTVDDVARFDRNF